MQCWKRMEKISWTDHVRNEEILQLHPAYHIVHTIKRRKANLTGHTLHRNCFLKHIIEGKVGGGTQVTGRRAQRHKQLQADLKKTRGYWKL
jgi:hypothetical protein